MQGGVYQVIEYRNLHEGSLCGQMETARIWLKRERAQLSNILGFNLTIILYEGLNSYKRVRFSSLEFFMVQ